MNPPQLDAAKDERGVFAHLSNPGTLPCFASSYLPMKFTTLIHFAFAAMAVSALSVQAATCPVGGISSTPPSAFTSYNDGTATHTATGLMWKKCAEGQTFNGLSCNGSASTSTWSASLSTAKNSNFAGYSDWRLPNKQELESVVDDSCHSPAINDTIFPNDPQLWTWTSTTVPESPAAAWIVNFQFGTTDIRDKGDNDKTVRLVRSGGSFDILAADTTPPDTAITSAPSNSTATAATITFSGSDNVASPLAFECRLDNAAFAACTSPYTQSNFNRGLHTFQVRARDAAGNVDQSPAAVTWRVTWDCPRYDVDGVDGPTAEVDAILILRYLLGIRGAALISDLTLSGSRTTATAIESYLAITIGLARLDVFGVTPLLPTATNDGIVLTRLMQGVADAQLLSGITVPMGSTLTTAAAIRSEINNRCVMP